MNCFQGFRDGWRVGWTPEAYSEGRLKFYGPLHDQASLTVNTRNIASLSTRRLERMMETSVSPFHPDGEGPLRTCPQQRDQEFVFVPYVEVMDELQGVQSRVQETL
jgi:hypothetical protein